MSTWTTSARHSLAKALPAENWGEAGATSEIWPKGPLSDALPARSGGALPERHDPGRNKEKGILLLLGLGRS